MTAALAHQTLGELAAMQGNDQVTDQEFAAALHLLGQSNAPERMLDCHLKYADILEKRGDWQTALFHLRQAVGVARPERAPTLTPPGERGRENAKLNLTGKR
jgi:hypothetical protein